MRPRSDCRQEDLLEVIDGLYASALGETGWGQAASVLRERLGLSVVSIHSDRPADGTSVVRTMQGPEPQWLERYETYYAGRNVWMQRAGSLLRPGRLIQGEELISRAEFRRTEYFHDFCRHNDIGNAVAVCIERRPGLFTLLSLCKGVRDDDFRREDLRRIEALLPHIRRATEAANQLHQLERRATLAESALDRLPVGILLLDEVGAPVHLNRAARELEAEQAYLARTPGKVFLRPEAQRKLEAILFRAGRLCRGGAFRLERPCPRHDLEVVAIPVGAVDGESTRWCVLLIDPLRTDPPSPSLLRQLFALTEAESHVASLLAAGITPPEIAELRRVSRNTLKTQVRSVYSKLGVESQVELVTRLSRHPADPSRPAQISLASRSTRS